MKSKLSVILSGVALLLIAVFVPFKTIAQVKELEFASYLKLIDGVKITVTEVEPQARPMPWWFAIVYDATSHEDMYPAFAFAECFRGLPCYKIDFTPKWRLLANVMDQANITLPSVYTSDLVPKLTSFYLESNCNRPNIPAYRRRWNIQLTAGQNAGFYEINDVYCSAYKTTMTKNGPVVSELTFQFGQVVTQ
ncbi:MAG: hypothetical protein N2691_02350 [Patescibacteria group bacterium]|nr:hypothetical protein [Patescibacteria group bacterium]